MKIECLPLFQTVRRPLASIAKMDGGKSSSRCLYIYPRFSAYVAGAHDMRTISYLLPPSQRLLLTVTPFLQSTSRRSGTPSVLQQVPLLIVSYLIWISSLADLLCFKPRHTFFSGTHECNHPRALLLSYVHRRTLVSPTLDCQAGSAGNF